MLLMANTHGITKDNPLRFGRLKMIGKSPAHFIANPPFNSAATAEGTAAHSHVLGGAPIVYYDKVTASGKQAPRTGGDFDKFKADQAPNAIILTRSQYDVARAMADAVLANRDAMRILDGEREKTIYWDDAGIPCRATPDAISPGIRAELKTGETSDPRDFVYKVLKFGYHGQLAWYEQGEILSSGTFHTRTNYIVAVEAKSPNVCTVFKLTDEDMDKGRRMVVSLMEKLRNCMASENYPGYATGIVDLNLPGTDESIVFGDE